TVAAYNQTVGSLERRVLPTARRFSDLAAAGRKEMPTLTGGERSAQLPQAPELRPDAEPEGFELPAPPQTDPDAAERRSRLRAECWASRGTLRALPASAKQQVTSCHLPSARRARVGCPPLQRTQSNANTDETAFSSSAST